MTFRIRTANEADRPQAIDLAHRLTEGVAPWHDPAGVGRAVRAWVDGSMSGLDGDDRTCLVAEQDGLVIGFASVSETNHWTGAKDAYIGELMVAKHAEGRGVGRALVEHAADWGRARRCRRISLETGAGNLAARRFYRSLDFQDDDIRLSRAL